MSELMRLARAVAGRQSSTEAVAAPPERPITPATVTTTPTGACATCAHFRPTPGKTPDGWCRKLGFFELRPSPSAPTNAMSHARCRERGACNPGQAFVLALRDRACVRLKSARYSRQACRPGESRSVGYRLKGAQKLTGVV